MIKRTLKWAVIAAIAVVGGLGWLIAWAIRTMDPPTPPYQRKGPVY